MNSKVKEYWPLIAFTAAIFIMDLGFILAGNEPFVASRTVRMFAFNQFWAPISFLL